MTNFYDKDGTPITMQEWGDKRTREYIIIGRNFVWWRNRQVSTVWLGLNHGWDGELEIFETMVFKGKGLEDVYCKRYATEAEAVAGHQAVLRKLRWGGRLKGYHAL